MGWLIFAEALPPLWWLGASLLVAGSVIIGRRDEEEKARGAVPVDRDEVVEPAQGQEEEDTLLGDMKDVEDDSIAKADLARNTVQ